MKTLPALFIRLAASGPVMLAVATAWLRPVPSSLDWPLWLVLCGALAISPAGLALLNHVFHDESPDVGRGDPVCVCIRAVSNLGLVLAACLPAGALAALGVLPWVAIAAATAGRAGWALWIDPRRLERWLVAAAAGQLAVGALWLLADRLGAAPWGYDPTTTRITAAHFHFAGFLLPLNAAILLREGKNGGRTFRLCAWGVLVGFPAVAAAIFLRRWGLALEWECAVAALFASASVGVGLHQVAVGLRARKSVAMALLALGGVALAVGSTLGLAFALRPWLAIEGLTWPTLWKWHGTLQALGFTIPTLIGWRTACRALPGPLPCRRHGAAHAVWMAACD